MPEPGRDRANDLDDLSSAAPIFSRYGVISAILGVIAVVALSVTVVVTMVHRDQITSDRYDSRVMDTAVGWVSTLINMNKANVDASVQKLQDASAGRLGDGLSRIIAGYVQLARTLNADAVGEVDSVAIQRLGLPAPDPDLPSAERTDRVLVVAASVTRLANTPAKVHPWHLRLGISKVGDRLLVTTLEVFA